MAFIEKPELRAKTEVFQQSAINLRRYANLVDEIAMTLDDSALTCDGCGGTHYLNWPQRQLRARVSGAGDRLREIADVFQRRANDPDFLNGTPLDHRTSPHKVDGEPETSARHERLAYGRAPGQG